MMNWYITRDDCSLVHRGQNIPPKTKLFLTKDQAKLHNTEREQVVECEAPASESEVAVLADWKDFKASLPVEMPKAKEEGKVKSNK